MKKLLLISTLLISFAYTQAQNSGLILKMWDNSPFHVRFAGLDYNTDNIFIIENLYEGRFKMTVYQDFGSPYQTREIVVFDGYVDIPYSSMLKAKIDKFGSFVVKGVIYDDNECNSHSFHGYNCRCATCSNAYANRNDRPYDRDAYNDDRNRPYDRDENRHDHDRNSPYDRDDNYDYDDNTNRNDDYDDNRNHNHRHENPYNNNFDFEAFKTAIDNENFDDKKLLLAQQTITGNYFTSYEICETAKLMRFEDSRLKFAKYAYQYCLDPVNYFKVSEAFSFITSKEELTAYILQFKQRR